MQSHSKEPSLPSSRTLREKRRYFKSYLQRHNIKYEEARFGAFEIFNMVARRHLLTTSTEIIAMTSYAIEAVYDLLPESVPYLRERAKAVQKAHDMFLEINKGSNSGHPPRRD